MPPLGRAWGAALLLAVLLLPACGRDQALYDEAMAAFDRGEMERAERQLTDLLVHDPDGPLAPDALLQRGHLFSLYLDNPAEALADYGELARRFPRHPLAREAHRRLAELYDTHFDRPEKAVEHYQAMLTGFPGHPGNFEAGYKLGELLFRLLRFDEARAAFAAAGGKGAPGDWAERSLFQTGVCYATEGREPDAEAVWREVLSRFPEGKLAPQAALNLASILERLGKGEEAIALLTEKAATASDPEPLTRRIERIRERQAQLGPGTRFRVQRPAVFAPEPEVTPGRPATRPRARAAAPPPTAPAPEGDSPAPSSDPGAPEVPLLPPVPPASTPAEAAPQSPPPTPEPAPAPASP